MNFSAEYDRCVDECSATARKLAESARELSCTGDEDTMRALYVRIRGQMDDLTRAYEWANHARIMRNVYERPDRLVRS